MDFPLNTWSSSLASLLPCPGGVREKGGEEEEDRELGSSQRPRRSPPSSPQQLCSATMHDHDSRIEFPGHATQFSKFSSKELGDTGSASSSRHSSSTILVFEPLCVCMVWMCIKQDVPAPPFLEIRSSGNLLRGILYYI